MRDEVRVQKELRKIWANMSGVSISDVDDSFLDVIEMGTSDEVNYTNQDYKIILFNLLNEFEKFSLRHSKFREKIIKQLTKVNDKLGNLNELTEM